MGHTCDDHHAYGEDLLIVCLCCHVAEPHRRHAGHGKVEGGHVHGLLARPIDKLRGVRAVGEYVGVWRLGDVGELPQPRVLDPVVCVAFTCVEMTGSVAR